MSAADTPVLHMRGDQVPLMLAVVAAARALCREQYLHGECGRKLDTAVAAYERAIAPGAGA